MSKTNKPTLLEKAKSVATKYRPRNSCSPEELDLAIAWLRSEISSTQASTVLEISLSNVGQALSSHLKAAHSHGLVTITKTKP
jgi:hypothetical protein